MLVAARVPLPPGLVGSRSKELRMCTLALTHMPASKYAHLYSAKHKFILMSPSPVHCHVDPSSILLWLL